LDSKTAAAKKAPFEKTNPPIRELMDRKYSRKKEKARPKLGKILEIVRRNHPSCEKVQKEKGRYTTKFRKAGPHPTVSRNVRPKKGKPTHKKKRKILVFKPNGHRRGECAGVVLATNHKTYHTTTVILKRKRPQRPQHGGTVGGGAPKKGNV